MAIDTTDDWYQVGILFVHGIGDQKRADTLVRFGEALTDCLGRWLSGDDETKRNECVLVRWADLSERADDAPAHASLVWNNGNQQDKWLLAESWWAETFESPRYSDLLRWAFRILPWTIATHLYRRFALAGKWWKVFSLLLFTAGVIVLPLVAVLLVASLALGILPIPRLRSAILRIQRVLLGTVGDSFVLNESSIRGVAMSSQVLHDLAWLKKRCGRVVVLAHSQGAAVTHAALKSLVAQGLPENCPSRLVTFGAGLRKLLLLRTVGSREIAASWVLSFALASISWVAWVVINAIWQGDLADPNKILLEMWGGAEMLSEVEKDSFPFNFATKLGIDLWDWKAFFVGSLLAGFAMGLFAGHGIVNRLATGAGFALGMGVLLAVLYPLMSAGPYFFGALLYSPAIILFCARYGKFNKDNDSRELFISDDMGWHDFYAAADPVPNGPITRESLSFMGSTKVNNRNSLVSDHTTYWENVEQFVLAVARIIANVSEKDIDLSWKDPYLHERAFQRRVWRVRCLALSRWAVTVSIVVAAYMMRERVWVTLQQVPPVLTNLTIDILDFLRNIPVLRLLVPASEETWLPPTLWITVGILALLLSRRLVWLVWRLWDRSERSVFFRREDFQVVPGTFLLLIVAVASVSLVALCHEQFVYVWQSFIHANPDLEAILDKGLSVWPRLTGERPLGIVAATPTIIGGAAIGAFGLDWLLEHWNYGGARYGGPVFSRTNVYRAAWCFPATLLGVALFSWLVFGTGTREPADISRWVAGFLMLPMALIAILWGVFLWSLTQLQVCRRAWAHVQFLTASDTFGGWLAWKWRRIFVDWKRTFVDWKRMAEDDGELNTYLEYLINEHRKDGTSGRDTVRGSIEAEAVCRALSKEELPERVESLVMQLAKLCPYAGIVYADAVKGKDAGAAVEILQGHVHTRFPRAAWNVKRRLHSLRRDEGNNA